MVSEAQSTESAERATVPPRVLLTTYDHDTIEQLQISSLSEIQAQLQKERVLWLDFEGLGDPQLIADVGKLFEIHPLSLEDVLNPHQRAKVESYENYFFFVTHMLSCVSSLETEQLSVMWGKNFVLTFQAGIPGDCFGGVKERLRRNRGKLRERGADYLAYALIDAVIDGYFPVLEDYGERLDSIEDAIIAAPTPTVIEEVHCLKRDLLKVRRAIWPQRDAVNSLIRDSSALVADETRIYLRDCYDHLVRLIDIIETYRELCADLMDLYMSTVSNQMNEVMKVLTVISTLFIPLTFLAGLYGMNFNTQASPYSMPELNWAWGYPALLLVMFLIALAMATFFYRRGWIGKRGL